MKNCLILLFLSLTLVFLAGCSDNEQAQQTAPAAPTKKENTSPPQQHNKTADSAPEAHKERTEAAPWPPIKEQQDNILPADQWTRKNYVMIFDGSGSMEGQRCSGNRLKIQVAKDAVIEWAQSIHEDAHLGLIAFDKNGLSVRLQLGEGNREEFIQKVQAVKPGAGTPLTKSVQQAYDILTDQARKQLGYGEYHMVIVTDGAAGKPDNLTKAINTVLYRSPIIINTIGFCISETHSLNQPGRTVYKAADNPDALRQSLHEVLAESESFDDVTEF